MPFVHELAAMERGNRPRMVVRDSYFRGLTDGTLINDSVARMRFGQQPYPINAYGIMGNGRYVNMSALSGPPTNVPR